LRSETPPHVFWTALPSLIFVADNIFGSYLLVIKT